MSLKVIVAFVIGSKSPPASEKSMNFCPPGPTRRISKSPPPAEAVKLFSVIVTEEIDPTVPETVMFDWTLAAPESGIGIDAGFEKTVNGLRSSDRLADADS